MDKPSSSPKTVGAQRAELERERADLSTEANCWKGTQDNHRDRMASYRADMERRYFLLGQVYDFESDANIQYWDDQIAFCEYELGLCRERYKRIKKLLAR